MSLQELGIKHGTDKATVGAHGKTYLDIYETYFEPMRDDHIRLLEIGVRKGESVRLWKEYFKNGKIFGIDIDPECLTSIEDRIEVYTYSQDAIPPQLDAFDIIIDDGSHINYLTVASFAILWRRVKPGGFYIIDDLKSSYDYLVSQSIEAGSWPGMQHGPKAFSNDRWAMNSLFLDIIRDMDFGVRDFRTVQFWNQMVVIQKV